MTDLRGGVSGAPVQRRSAILAAALAVAIAAALTPAVSAHDFWIEPSTFRPAVPSTVAIHLRVGVGFAGDPVPRTESRVVRFEIAGPTGLVPAPGVAGADPAALAPIRAAGLHFALYESNHAFLELPAEKFDGYLAEEGLEALRAVRDRRGLAGQSSHERYSRHVKSALCAGGVGGAGFDRAFGLALEVVPGVDPCAVAAGGELPVRLLFAGRPLVGARVAALRKGVAGERFAGRTDAAGRVTVPIDAPGIWIVKAVWMEPVEGVPGVDWQSFWSSLTFEIAAP